jgi:Txe/YoeB family toxin of Txe-Axe toxin-antitoxin module
MLIFLENEKIIIDKNYVKTRIRIISSIPNNVAKGKRKFGPMRDEVTGQWRKLHNEELRDLYSSPSISRIIKLRRMRWAGTNGGEEERV